MNLKQAYSIENKILFKVNNEIITNQDIKLEEKYLTVLNLNLKNVDKSKLNDIAKNSIIKGVFINTVVLKNNRRNIYIFQCK